MLLLITHLGFGQTRELNVLQLEKDRFKAMISKDSIKLDQVLADDLLYIHSNGIIDSKETFIKRLVSYRQSHRCGCCHTVVLRRY